MERSGTLARVFARRRPEGDLLTRLVLRFDQLISEPLRYGYFSADSSTAVEECDARMLNRFLAAGTKKIDRRSVSFYQFIQILIKPQNA